MTIPTNREELIRLRAKVLFECSAKRRIFKQQWEDVRQRWRDGFIESARATLEAEEAAGVVCVPKEQTGLMFMVDGWDSMLAVSPFVKEEQE